MTGIIKLSKIYFLLVYIECPEIAALPVAVWAEHVVHGVDGGGGGGCRVGSNGGGGGRDRGGKGQQISSRRWRGKQRLKYQ